MENDDAYHNSAYVPDAEDIVAGWQDESLQFRQAEAAIGRARLNTAYGEHPREMFDLFHPAGRAAGLLVLVHGGYWLSLDRTYFSVFAEGATGRDWAVAVPSYPICPEVSIGAISTSIAAAIEAAGTFVAGPIALAGHSAGAHLVARAAMGDTGLSNATKDRLTSVASISPVTDLRPLLQTTMNQTLGLDAEQAEAESPALHPKGVDADIAVWVGANERPAFLDQARYLAEAWPGAGHHVIPDRHHFDIVDALRDPEGEMMRAIVG